MQFEMTSTVFNCRKMTIEGRTFCSVITGQAPVGDNSDTLGYEVTKIIAEPGIFDQLKQEGYQPGQPPRDFKLVAMLKTAAGGKSQPYIIGVVPSQKTTTSPDAKSKPAA